MPKVPQLDLKTYTVQALSFEARNDFDPGIDLLSQVELGYSVEPHPEGAPEFAAFLSIRLGTEQLEKANLPYTVAIRIAGVFQAARELKPLELESELVINALTILYGVARGHVAQSTGVGMYGKLVLPAVSFADLVEETRPRTATAEASKKSPKSGKPLQRSKAKRATRHKEQRK